MEVASVPLSQRQYYRPSETVDFELSPGVNMSIVPNSIRLCGRVIFTNDYTAANPAPLAANQTGYFIDAQIGAHSFLRQVVTQTDKQGVIQNLQDYHRCMADLRAGTKTADMAMNNDSMSLVTGNALLSQNVIGTQSCSWAINPEIAINRSLTPVPFGKTGNIKLNLILNSAKNVVFGAPAVANLGYVLTNLECHYFVTPSNNNGESKLVLNAMSSVKQVASSTLSAFTIMSPQPSYAMSVNFIPTADETSQNTNSCALGALPNISRVEFLFADTNSSIIQYPLENDKEVYRFWLKSYNSTKALTDAAGSSMGCAYDQVLQNTKFNIVIESGLAAPTSCYFVFKGLLAI